MMSCDLEKLCQAHNDITILYMMVLVGDHPKDIVCQVV